MKIHFLPRENGPKNMACEAEIHFEETDGILAGCRLVGFTLWKTEDGGYTVTMPSRTWGNPGERKFFDLVRAGREQEGPRHAKARIVAAYIAQRDQGNDPREDDPEDTRSDYVYQRAYEDWTEYEHSGHGPRDFATTAEWRAHCRRVNDGLLRVSWLVTRSEMDGKE